MMPDDVRVTARIVRTDDGENYTEYRVGGVRTPRLRRSKRRLKHANPPNP